MYATVVTRQQELAADAFELAYGRPHKREFEATPIAEPAPQDAKQDTPESRRMALEELYTAYVEQIYRFAYSHVGNREDAEDIASQVFITAATRIDINQDARKKLAWLYQVARNMASDYWRQFYKMSTSSLDDEVGDGGLNLKDPSLGTFQAEQPEEEDHACAARRVESVLSRLSPKYRQVLQLRFLEGCSLQATAQAMGTTLGALRVMQHRALQKAIKIGAELG